MANLDKVIKLTQTQYDTLKNGGTVGEYTGLNDNYLYLVQSEENYVDLTSDQNIQGIKTFRDGINLEMAPNILLGQDHLSEELICVLEQGSVLTSDNNILIYVENEQLKLHNLAEPTNDSDAATKNYVDLVNLESQIKVKRFI